MRIRYHGSDTAYCGTIHMVNQIVAAKSLAHHSHESLVTWVTERTSSAPDAPVPLFRDEDLSDVWHKVRNEHLEAAKQFLIATIRSVQKHVPSGEHDHIHWYLTGGGALDPTIEKMYDATIKSHFPQASPYNEGFSKSWYVITCRSSL
jgi:hypothetical protein